MAEDGLIDRRTAHWLIGVEEMKLGGREGEQDGDQKLFAHVKQFAYARTTVYHLIHLSHMKYKMVIALPSHVDSANVGDYCIHSHIGTRLLVYLFICRFRATRVLMDLIVVSIWKSFAMVLWIHPERKTNYMRLGWTMVNTRPWCMLANLVMSKPSFLLQTDVVTMYNVEYSIHNTIRLVCRASELNE